MINRKPPDKHSQKKKKKKKMPVISDSFTLSYKKIVYLGIYILYSVIFSVRVKHT